MDNKEMEKFWKDKEEELNEKLVNRACAYYEGGHPDYPDRAFGLLYLMSGSLNFENFEKKVMLPVKKPEFKKIEFRLPVKQIKSYRIKLPERVSWARFWEALKKDESSRIELDCNFGFIKTVVFTGIVPLSEWEESLEKVVKKG